MAEKGLIRSGFHSRFCRSSVRRQTSGGRSPTTAEQLSTLLHPEFAWTTHAGETYDRREYVRRNTEGHTTWRSQDLAGVDVVVVGDTAVLRAEVTDVVLSDGGDHETFRMPMTQVWVRTDGAWSCLAGHAGPRRV